jgi:hypothetical protein
VQRHTGGVQGTTLLRGYCPVCGRGIAGGNVMAGAERGSRISLRPHKPRRFPGSDAPAKNVADCAGSRSVVWTDRELTGRFGRAKRGGQQIC